MDIQTTRKPTSSNIFIHFFFFFFLGGPWSEPLLLPESELADDEEEEEEDEEELSSSSLLLLSLSSEEELEESLLSDDESLDEPSESLLLSLPSFALRANDRALRCTTEARTPSFAIKVSLGTWYTPADVSVCNREGKQNYKTYLIFVHFS